MITFRRSATLPRVGAQMTIHDALHPLFRVRILRGHGGAHDEDMLYPGLEWTGKGGRALLSVVLSGHQRIRCGESKRSLEAGMMAGSRLEETYSRSFGEPLKLLICEWEPGSLGGRYPDDSVGKVSERDLAYLTELADAVEDARFGQIELACARLFATLRALGVPFDPPSPDAYRRAGDTAAQSIATPLSTLFCHLEEKPTLGSLAVSLGLTRRQAHRRVASFVRRYGLNGDGFRTMLERWRMVSAAYLLAADGARTQDVAQAVGFSDSRVLCNSFREAGLPSPQRIRAEIAARA